MFSPFQDGRTHFALAFELLGGWRKEKDAMALTVLQVFTMNILLWLSDLYDSSGLDHAPICCLIHF